MSTLQVDSISTRAGANNTTVLSVASGLIRAWCHYDGTNQVINGSYNISSVTKNAVGDYTFNFTTAVPTSNTVGFGCTTSPMSRNADDALGVSTTGKRMQYLNGSLVQSDSSYINFALIS